MIFALVFLAGCSGRSTHPAYVTLPTTNRVAGYHIDNSGNFTSMFNSPFFAGTSPAAVVIDPSGKFAYVANQGENDIAIYQVDSSTDGLIEIPPRTPAGSGPAFLELDSSGSVLFALNRISANISVYSIGSDGALTQVTGSPFAVGGAPGGMTVSPSSKFLYVTLPNVASVVGFTISNGTPTIIPGSPFPVGSGPLGITIDPAEHFAYVMNALAGTFSVLSIDSTTGALTEIGASPFAAATNPVAAAFDSSGQFLYVVNQGSNDVSGFTVDSSTGVPTAMTDTTGKILTFTAGTQPSFIILDTTGKFLFVGNQGSKDITVFSIDPKTGELTKSGATVVTGTAPSSMFVLK